MPRKQLSAYSSSSRRNPMFWKLARIEPQQDNIARSAYFSKSSGKTPYPFLVVWNAHTRWSAVRSCYHSVFLLTTTFHAFHPSELSSSPLIVPKPHAAHTSPLQRASTTQDASIRKYTLGSPSSHNMARALMPRQPYSVAVLSTGGLDNSLRILPQWRDRW